MFLVFIAFGTMARLAPAGDGTPTPGHGPHRHCAAQHVSTAPLLMWLAFVGRCRGNGCRACWPVYLSGRAGEIWFPASLAALRVALYVRLHRAAGSDLRLGPVAADGIAALANRRGSAQCGAPLLAAAVRH